MVHTWRTLPNWQTETDGAIQYPDAAASARAQRDVFARWGSLIATKAAKYGVPPELVAGVMVSESWGDPNAGSSAGAQGLMQVMPFHFPAGTTSAQMLEPDRNVDLGVSLLADAIKRVGRDVPRIAACYNAGGVYADQGKYFDARDDWGFRQNHAYDGTAYASNVTRYTNLAIARGLAAPLRVMPIGDSLTTGWAPLLPASLATFGAVNVGRFGSSPGVHEGRSGWTAAQLHAEMPAAFKAGGVPDVAIFAWGTNDAIAKRDPALVVGETATAMDDAYAAGVRGVVLVPPPPITRASEQPFAAAFVASVRAGFLELVRLERAKGRQAEIAIVDEQPDPGDGVHFGPPAYARIAATVATAVRNLASQLHAVATSSSSSSSSSGLASLIAVAFGLYLLSTWKA